MSTDFRVDSAKPLIRLWICGTAAGGNLLSKNFGVFSLDYYFQGNAWDSKSGHLSDLVILHTEREVYSEEEYWKGPPMIYISRFSQRKKEDLMIRLPSGCLLFQI